MALRVEDKYRTNKLSIKPGGNIVCTRNDKGQVLEYDKIKYPFAYIKQIKKANPDIKCWWVKDNPEKVYDI